MHPEHADDDENTLMIARIDHERVEREKLEQQRQELLKRKQKLIADNKKRKEDLASLDQDLEKFIDVSGTPLRIHGLVSLGTVLTVRLSFPVGCQANTEALRKCRLNGTLSRRTCHVQKTTDLLVT